MINQHWQLQISNPAFMKKAIRNSAFGIGLTAVIFTSCINNKKDSGKLEANEVSPSEQTQTAIPIEPIDSVRVWFW
jgi:hypothetical protein